MDHNRPQISLVDIHPLTVIDFLPYGWMLGQPIRLDGSIPAFRNAEIDFWQEHIFNPGAGGEAQILWVNYRDKRREIPSLEVHNLCQQAVIPLTGEIIQVVAGSENNGAPDISSIKAFRVPVGHGICMQAGCWHTT